MQMPRETPITLVLKKSGVTVDLSPRLMIWVIENYLNKSSPEYRSTATIVRLVHLMEALEAAAEAENQAEIAEQEREFAKPDDAGKASATGLPDLHEVDEPDVSEVAEP